MEAGRDRGNSRELTIAPHTTHPRLLRKTLPVSEIVFLFHLQSVSHCAVHKLPGDQEKCENRFLFIFTLVAGFESTLGANGKPLGMSLRFRVAD